MSKKIKTSLKGKALLRNPLLNRGTAFTERERKELELDGLLPPGISSMTEQLKRRYANFTKEETQLGKYRTLMDLQNRNETLFYKLVLENVEEMLPYVYTPTVGDAAIAFSHDYHTSRGLFISSDMEDIESALRNSGRPEVDVIVATDGSRILGLGDVGVGGMVIPIGKLALYTLFGGVSPNRTLPIFLDCGTDNKDLRSDPLYVGKRSKRLRGEEYEAFIDRFVKAVKKVYPNALLQWEDFEKDHALKLLDKYKSKVCSFNDDIQGTATVGLAGLLTALKIKKETFLEQRIVIYGAGSAGVGIANLIVDYLAYHNIPKKKAYDLIYMIGRRGLIHDGLDNIRPEVMPFARKEEEVADWKKKEGHIHLKTTIETCEATILIGVSTHKDAFTKDIVKKMHTFTDHPIIFPLSNPNSKSEAHPKDLHKHTDGKVLVATGSPYGEILHKGETIKIPQCNNVYVFPSIGLACATVPIKKITTNMFIAAAETLSEHAHPSLFPSFEDLREISLLMAKRVIEVANEEGLVENMPDEPLEYLLKEKMYSPEYLPVEWVPEKVHTNT